MSDWNELKRKAESKKAEGFELVHNLPCDQILALIAENERLNACLKLEQNRAERIGTHGPGCESWGPSHYECLLRERDQLKAECEALRYDAELGVDRISKLAGEVSRLRSKHQDWNNG